METVLNILLIALGTYLACGLLVAIYLHTGPIRRFDPNVSGTGWGFRLLITPGLAALWPLLLRRLTNSAESPAATPYEAPIRATRLLALQRLGIRLLAIATPPLFLLALLARAPHTVAPHYAGLLQMQAPAPTDAPLQTLRCETPAFRVEIHRGAVVFSADSDLAIPELQAWWLADAAAKPILIGPVWGPARLSYTLPNSGGLLRVRAAVTAETYLEAPLP